MKHDPFPTQLILGDVLNLVNGNIAVVIRTSAIAVRLNIPLGGAFAKLKPCHPEEVSLYPSAGGICTIYQPVIEICVTVGGSVVILCHANFMVEPQDYADKETLT